MQCTVAGSLRNVSDIYPEELESKKEHGDKSASFLGLDIRVENEKFSARLYDKRDAFPFKIVRMPDKRPSVPIFSSCIGAEILRIARISLTYRVFVDACHSLFKHIWKQGASKAGIRAVLNKMYGRHKILKNFGMNAKEFANKILKF